jgi:hypothetical protein
MKGIMKRNDIDHNTKSFIELMDLDELIRLHEYIVKRIRLISDTKTMKKVQGFDLLERVYFTDDRGNRIDGRIIRLNKKTITVKAENGMEWRVSPEFLKRPV